MESKGMDCMNLQKHFLPKDIKKASEEYWRTMDLLSCTMEHIQSGDIDTAKHHSIELLLSIHKMSKMSSKKYAADREFLVNNLNNMGVHAELVRRSYLD